MFDYNEADRLPLNVDDASNHNQWCAIRFDRAADCTCEQPGAWRVVRFYFNKPGQRRTIIDRCTLAQAQVHCNDPETSSATATSSAGRARTRKLGPWFDGYEQR